MAAGCAAPHPRRAAQRLMPLRRRAPSPLRRSRAAPVCSGPRSDQGARAGPGGPCTCTQPTSSGLPVSRRPVSAVTVTMTPPNPRGRAGVRVHVHVKVHARSNTHSNTLGTTHTADLCPISHLVFSRDARMVVAGKV